jgi:hypothetical protein
MKQSAVEWLANELYEKFEMKGDGALFNDLLNQAKEMEKQQIQDAYDKGNRYMFEQSGEKYYNETFKNK